MRSLAATIAPGIEIREIDIAVEPEMARRYRVMSLPTTIVLDAEGQVTDINVGFASGEVLRRQLVDAGNAGRRLGNRVLSAHGRH